MEITGLITVKSDHEPRETMDRLAEGVTSAGLTVFARIDHARGAAQVHLPLRPTELLIFGNAQGGTPLMQFSQTIGIDLPLKALVWQDESGTTWIAYNDPRYLAARHNLPREAKETADKMAHALAAVTAAAAR